MTSTADSADSADSTSALRGPAGRRRHRLPPALRGWVIPGALLLTWWAVRQFGWISSPLLPPIEAVWQRALAYTASGELWLALAASLGRTVAGLAVGVAAGLILGSALGLSRWIERFIGPSFHTFKQISLFAWVPLISVWFGLGDAAKVVFIALAAFFPVVLNTFEGIRSVPRELVEVGRVLKFTPAQRLWRLVLPSAMPSILTGIHLALVYAWLAALGAEYLLVSGSGIGATLVDGREHLAMDLVIFGVIVIGLVGFALNWLGGLAERRLLAWRGTSTGQFDAP